MNGIMDDFVYKILKFSLNKQWLARPNNCNNWIFEWIHKNIS